VLFSSIHCTELTSGLPTNAVFLAVWYVHNRAVLHVKVCCCTACEGYRGTHHCNTAALYTIHVQWIYHIISWEGHLCLVLFC
jgi:hypothetical protein